MNWKVALTEKSEDPEGELMETSHILVFFKTQLPRISTFFCSANMC